MTERKHIGNWIIEKTNSKLVDGKAYYLVTNQGIIRVTWGIIQSEAKQFMEKEAKYIIKRLNDLKMPGNIYRAVQRCSQCGEVDPKTL
jgi:hypothetical protein